MTTIRTKFVPIAVCLAFGLAACGDDKKSEDTTTSAAETTNAPDTSGPDTSVDDSEAGDVFLADSALGQILVDPDGFTLYLFASDPPDTVTCTGGCAGTWPPLLVEDDHIHVGDELNEDLFTIVAGDGGQQWSYNGHPLYYYAGDTAPGETNGQGVGGVWFVVDAEGNAVT